jgi:type II secretory pathway component PulJ
VKKNNSWFTLIELVVAFTITAFIITGVMYFFAQVVNSTTSLVTSSDLFTWTEKVDKLLDDFVEINPYNEMYNTWSVSDERWADILLLQNDPASPTSWILFWVYNNTDSEITVWNIINYKDYRLFYKELDNTAVNNARWNLTWYTSALTKDDISIIDWINLIKFWVSTLEWKIKVDLRLTPVFYKNISWEHINVFKNNDEVEDYYISFLK